MNQKQISRPSINEAYAQIEEKVPEFMNMTSDQLIDWCIVRYERLKTVHGLTHQALANEANMPKGTVDRILAGNYHDFKYSTIQPLIAAMLRQNDPIPDPVPAGKDSAVDDVQELLVGYRIALREKDEQIPQLLEHIVQMDGMHAKAIEDLRQDSQRKVDYLKGRILRKDRIIFFLSLALAAVLLLVLSILIYDKLNPDVGWFRDTAALLIR